MAATAAVLSNHCRYQLMKKQLNLLADSIKILLMRDGFVFNKDTHAAKINIINSYAASTIGVNASLALVDSANGFITAGFVPGMQITTSGFVTNAGNNATKEIATVAAGEITVTDTTGFVEEAASEAITIVGNDELAEGVGYLRDTKTLGSVVLTESDANDRAELTCADVVWAASGGAIGPTPGAILYDNDSSDDTIIGYLDFSTDRTVQDTQDFVIGAIKILGT